MSFGQRTPESLLPRSDSKNPATTCKGLTSNGRPCRRALAQSPRASPVTSPSKDNGVLAVLQVDNEHDIAAYYCWQHKDQAQGLAATNQQTRLVSVKERTSLDTLVDRIGVINLDDDAEPQRQRKRRRLLGYESNGLKKRDNLPPGWQQLQTPVMSVRPTHPTPNASHTNRVGRSNTKASVSCCLRTDDSDDDRPTRRVPQHASRPSPHNTSRPITVTTNMPIQTLNSRHSPIGQPPTPSLHPPSPQSAMLYPTLPALETTPARPTNDSFHPGIQTQHYLSLIPNALPPGITSLLLAELSKSISAADESGYIYIFWLTPDSESSKPDDETASSLMDDDPGGPTDRGRRKSEALQRYASQRRPSHTTNSANESSQSRKTIMLKIGRAANVHRRLNQWTKQCNQNITLIRYYPYASSAGAPPRQVPHVHRVERLIHIEMAEKRVQHGLCAECGREHREWFEVEASRIGLKAVDECVRRWVGWAERAT